MMGKYDVKKLVIPPDKKEILSQIDNRFLTRYSSELPKLNREQRREKATELIKKEIERNVHLTKDDVGGFMGYIAGYGLIDPLLRDDEIEEVLINGADVPVMIYHRELGKCVTNLKFKDDAELSELVDKIMIFSGVTKKDALVDAILPDGPRVNLTLPPVAFRRPTVTIRKYLENPPSMVDLIKNETMSSDMAALLWMCVDGFGYAARNILVTGGTSSGKTTFLNALLPFTREHERIVSIEDTLELDLSYCPDWVRTTTTEEVDMEKLVQNSLRLRPDRVIVGEVRGPEAFNLINAMNLGHTGMGTIHADSARDAILKLSNPPMNVDNKMLVVLDIIVVVNRFQEGRISKRRVTHISEVGGMMEDKIQLGSVYSYNAKKRRTEFEKFPAVTMNKIAEIVGLTPKDVINEIRRREKILRYLVRNNITREEDVINFVREYYDDPKKVWKRVSLAG